MKKHWILAIGVLSLCIWIAPAILRIDYDAGGIVGGFYWAFQVAALPYWAVDEILHPHPGITALLGLVTFWIVDWRFNVVRQRKQNAKNMGT